jgi:hypothetical protein
MLLCEAHSLQEASDRFEDMSWLAINGKERYRTVVPLFPYLEPVKIRDAALLGVLPFTWGNDIEYRQVQDPTLYAGSFVFLLDGYDDESVATYFHHDQFTTDETIQHTGGVTFLKGATARTTLHEIVDRIKHYG